MDCPLTNNAMQTLKELKPSSALLVGRVNVGKSTIFNRLLNRYQAITSAEAGTTRDLNRSLLTWQGKTFWLIDSGGYHRSGKDLANQASRHLLQRALNEAAVILHLVDGQTGLTPEDRELARQLRSIKAHRILVVNKIDSQNKRLVATGISLGYPDTIMVSAKNGSGLGDLLDLVVAHIESTNEPSPSLRAAFIGQTNVGKSSLFNALLKTDRSLVLPTPHTTRDRVHDFLETSGLTIELIDTAGLRRQHNLAPTLEKQSAKQSLNALQRVEVAFITIDGSVPPSWQDQHIAQQITEVRLAAVILLTKADLVNKEERLSAEKRLDHWMPMLSWAPRLWVSAVSGEGVNKILPLAQAASASWHQQLTKSELDNFWAFLKRNRTTGRLPLADFAQTSISPPTFKLTLKQKTNPPLAIGDWAASQLRKKFSFLGSPIIVRMETTRQAK